MSTLLFCTSYGVHPEQWRLRYGRWLRQARSSGLRYDRLAMIDDGSPVLPDRVRVFPAGRPPTAAEVAPGEVELHRFDDNLGRRTIEDFPGWYRSFAYAAEIARSMGADKLVHVESDAALTSHEMVAWINGFDEGWGTPWSAMYNFPEMAIQVVAGSAVRTFCELFSEPYDWLRDRMHETALPFTHVVRTFVGDRHSGDAAIPPDADFVTQLPYAREDGFAWWEEGLGGGPAESAPPAGPDALFRYDFAPEGEGYRRCGFGWAGSESQFRWTVGLDSWIDLPPGLPAAALLLTLSPCVEKHRHPFQKLEVHLDGRELLRTKISAPTRLRVPLPGGTGGGRLRLHHPDPVRPCDLVPGFDDGRHIGLYMHELAALPA